MVAAGIKPHAHREHFDALTRDEQAAAIRRLAAQGFSAYAISHATGLSVEAVREILSSGRLAICEVCE